MLELCFAAGAAVVALLAIACERLLRGPQNGARRREP